MVPSKEEVKRPVDEDIRWNNLRLKSNPFEASLNIGLFVVQDCMVIFGGQTKVGYGEIDSCYLFYGQDPLKAELT